ncbi:hypothetical protein [Paraburkholderia bannensis]|uniref:hypothetical protein n=1 Tax=Paraburkholderia bannensis TaxID=765414 RepID=UPI002AB5F605|nr:hypothetical protein [Paraburkholderia bannensis]
MEPIPAKVVKTYPPRGPLHQCRFDEPVAFRCFRCGNTKKSKLITTYAGDWSRTLCNGCYGRLLSLYEIKSGSAAIGERAEQISAALLTLASADQQRLAERLFKASDNRANALSPEAIRFVATAEHIATKLESSPQLEWSPAIIGLCKAVEVEVIRRILEPIVTVARSVDLSADVKDKDMGRVAAFCSGISGKPPELGTFAHFLQTVIYSERRRSSSSLIRCFLTAMKQWTGSTWLLDPNGFHRSLTLLTTHYRNRAAHIDELTQADYDGCRELAIGAEGVIWKMIVSTETHR